MSLPTGPSGGAGGSGHDQAPGGAGYPVADLDGLMRAAQAALQNGHDAEVQQAMRQHYHDRPARDLPEMRVVIRRTALLLHNIRVVGGRLSPRRALILLANANWDVELAEHRYRELQDSDDSESKDEPEDGGSAEDEESEESGSDDPRDRFSVMRRLNRDVDRKVAKRYEPDNSKLFIRIRRPDGKKGTTFTYPHQPVDWNEPVKLINRWRSQVLRRNLGPARAFRTHFHSDEKEWLYQEHLRFESQRRSQGLVVDYSAMRWGEIMTRFNAQFAGRVLPGVSQPRPARTKVALRTERARIKKITDHTGIPAKNLKTSEASKSQDEDDEEDEADSGPISTRRGDPPPGKPPRRDDDNNQGGGLGGRAWRSVVGVEG